MSAASVSPNAAILRTVWEVCPAAIVVTDPCGCIEYVNPAFEKDSGYSAAEVTGANPRILNAGTQAPEVYAALWQTIASGKTWSGRLHNRRKDGTLYWERSTISPLCDPQGNILRYVAVKENVAGEQLLELSESRFRSYFELPLHGRCVTSPEKGWLEVNERLCSMLGYTRAEIVRLTWAEMTHPDDLAADVAQFDRMIAGEIEQYKLEKRFFRKDGTTIWTAISVGCVRATDGSVDHLVCVLDDITEFKQLDEDLRERERLLRESCTRYDDLVRRLPVGISTMRVHVNGTTSFEYVNDTFSEMLGLDPRQAPHTAAAVYGAVHPEDLAVLVDARRRALHTFSPFAWEGRTLGATRWLRLESAPVAQPSGDILWHGVLIEITRRKVDQERIVRLSMLYAALSKCSQAVMHSTNAVELLQAVCRIVVEHGGMKLAWIGMVDAASGKVRSVVDYGPGRGYLSGLEVLVDASDPLGRGPTGTAIREGIPCWCHDFPNDPRTAHCHERGARYGWQCTAAIPLRSSGKITGALTLYSDIADVFDEEVRELMVEMGDTINFALDHFADEDQRKKVEAELRILRIAVEQTANSIVITDPEGNIEYANPAFEKSTGYLRAEVLGRNPRFLHSGEQSASHYQQLWSSITSGEIWRGQFHNQRKDGSLYWESAIISPVSNKQGRIVHFVAIKDDITERKALEASLNQALIAAESGARVKSEFLAVMSHELRTPLNGVLGFAELLSYTPLDEEQAEHVETIRHSGNHLLSIVDDILDFSSLEKDALAIHAEPFPVSQLVKFSEDTICNSITLKGLEFRCQVADSVPEQILGDERRIGQILINLLGNAVKFTASGLVTLRIATITDDDRQFLDFSIEDTGFGISPETLQRLFKPFTQADSTHSRAFGGTGLGLAISKRLAEAMGGQITVASTPGTGSTFSFRLPLPGTRPASVQTHAPAPGIPELIAPAGDLVLVVEDDPVNRNLAGKMLQSLGYRVEFAANGAEAVETFAPEKYSAILMDIQMPVMNGLEAARNIRERESASHVQIIALTANVMPGDRERYLAGDMDEFLSKPFKRDELAAILKRLIGREPTDGCGKASN
ncbi:MAG: PAS domain S-box protein [Verrucomicrobiota bacterium]